MNCQWHSDRDSKMQRLAQASGYRQRSQGGGGGGRGGYSHYKRWRQRPRNKGGSNCQVVELIASGLAALQWCHRPGTGRATGSSHGLDHHDGSSSECATGCDDVWRGGGRGRGRGRGKKAKKKMATQPSRWPLTLCQLGRLSAADSDSRPPLRLSRSNPRLKATVNLKGLGWGRRGTRTSVTKEQGLPTAREKKKWLMGVGRDTVPYPGTKSPSLSRGHGGKLW